MEVALARANMQKTAYAPFRDMAVFDRELDLASLAPAFKSACGFRGLAAAAASGGTLAGHAGHSGLHLFFGQCQTSCMI